MLEENEATGKGPERFLGKTTRQRAHKGCDACRSMKNNAAPPRVREPHGGRLQAQVHPQGGCCGRRRPWRQGDCPPASERRRGQDRTLCRQRLQVGGDGGGIKGRTHSVRDLRAGVRRASPCRKAQKGEQPQAKNAPPERICIRRPEGGQRYFFSARGLPAPKCASGQ